MKKIIQCEVCKKDFELNDQDYSPADLFAVTPVCSIACSKGKINGKKIRSYSDSLGWRRK